MSRDSRKPHRGRIQAQGGGTEQSVKWEQDEPPTVAEGKQMLDDLKGKLTKKELKAREKAFDKAETYVERTAEVGGVEAFKGRSFYGSAKKGNVRVDIEITAGRAFVLSGVLLLLLTLMAFKL